MKREFSSEHVNDTVEKEEEVIQESDTIDLEDDYEIEETQQTELNVEDSTRVREFLSHPKEVQSKMLEVLRSDKLVQIIELATYSASVLSSLLGALREGKY